MKVSNPVVFNALLAKNADVECAVSNAFDELTIKKDGRYWRIYQGSNDAGMRVFDNPESAKKFIKEKWGDGWKIRVKNAEVEGAVAENAAFKVGDKVVMRDGRKGEVVSSAPGPMGGEMYHIRLEDGRLTDSAERNLTAANAVANGEFYAIFRYNGGKNEAHDGPFSTIEEARKFGIQQAGSRSGVSFVGVGDEDLNYVWHNARAKNVVANALATRRVAKNAFKNTRLVPALDYEVGELPDKMNRVVKKLKGDFSFWLQSDFIDGVESLIRTIDSSISSGEGDESEVKALKAMKPKLEKYRADAKSIMAKVNAI